MVKGVDKRSEVCHTIGMKKTNTMHSHSSNTTMNINKFNIFSNDFDSDSMAVQFFTMFVIVPLGVGLPIAITSPVITMIGDGLIGGVAQGAGYVQER